MVGMHYALGLDSRWGQAAEDSNCCIGLRIVLWCPLAASSLPSKPRRPGGAPPHLPAPLWLQLLSLWPSGDGSTGSSWVSGHVLQIWRPNPVFINSPCLMRIAGLSFE